MDESQLNKSSNTPLTRGPLKLSPQHVTTVGQTGNRAPCAAHVLSTLACRLHTHRAPSSPTARPRARIHGRGSHLPLRLALRRSEPEARISPRPPSSHRAVRAAVVVAPKAGGRGRQVVGGEGGREGPLLGPAGLRRASSVGARRRRGRGSGRRCRPGPVLRVPARVRRDGHRRHRVDIRVHERAAGVRHREHRQPPLCAHPGLLRRHRHPDLRVSVVQGRADGEQGRRGAGPQGRLPLNTLNIYCTSSIRFGNWLADPAVQMGLHSSREEGRAKDLACSLPPLHMEHSPSELCI